MITPYDNYIYRAVVGEKTEWKSKMLTTERFYALPLRTLHENTRQHKYATKTQNIHTLFRKDFTVKPCNISRALLFITGDDIYKLYVNSVFVGEGPAQSFTYAYNYNCFDVTSLIKQNATNTIGVHVYYQGLYNISLVSADNLHGMIAQLEITYADGSTETVISDSTWKYKESQARTARYIFGYETQFSEDMDLLKWDSNWYSADYDISAWHNALVKETLQPYTLIPQTTPPVEHKKIHPPKVEKLENGYFFDFGKEYSGTLGFAIKQNKGDIIEVRCGEELDANGNVMYQLRANCMYREFVTLTGRQDLVDFYEFKGFRYVEILNVSATLSADDVWMLAKNYPFPENTANFLCSDKTLEDIWNICAHGVKIGTQDTYLDCPTREKGGFVGDALVSGLTHLILTGDIRIYKKFITDCINSAGFCPGIPSHAPSNVLSSLADYSLLFPLFLQHYYSYTGDIEFIKTCLPVLDGIIRYYSRFENKDYLLEAITQPIKGDTPNPAILVDWPPELRDGYDFESAEKGICTPANIYYYGCIKNAALLYDIAGDKQKCRQLAEKCRLLEKSIINVLYDQKQGLFRDSDSSLHCGLHGNALPLFFGLVPPKGYAPIVNMLKEKRLCCGVYFAFFVIKGLYSIGEYELAYDLISGKDIHSWYNMLKSGATTCMEVWGPDQKWNTSWCHPWSSSPIYFFTMELMGIKPSSSGWKTVMCSPKIPSKPDSMSVEFPVSTGMIKASFVRNGDSVDYSISVPKNTKVIFDCNIDGINFKAL